MLLNGLKSWGFEVPSTEIPRRLIASIHGHRGKGKSHLGLTAPGPLVVFNLDIGLTGVVQKFLKQKEVMVMDLKMPPTQEEAEKEWSRFYAAWSAVLKDRHVKSIVVDTETELWELFRMAKFGQLTQILPYQYAPVNAEYARFLREILAVEKNLILLRHLVPLYINDKRTKDWEPKGFNGVEKIVEVVGEIGREEQGDWWLYVTKCRLKPEMDGRLLEGMFASFPWLATMCIEGTTPEDWV
jgi:hypothetical protein